MRRTILLLTAIVMGAGIGAGTALAAKPPHPSQAANGKKVWICHRTHSTKHPYVAIRIPAKQLVNMNGHGAPAMGDIVNATPTATSPVPQTPTAARAYCRSLGPLTPTKGGHAVGGTLTPAAGATVSGTNLSVRLRLGQAEICISATLTSTTTPAAPISVSGITLTQGTTVTTLSNFTSALPTNATSPVQLATCAPLSRTIVKSILTGTPTTLTIMTSAGNLTATLS
jgi:hypothetical protein